MSDPLRSRVYGDFHCLMINLYPFTFVHRPALRFM